MEYDFIMFVNHDVESQGRAIRWWDEYETGPDRTVLTSDELFIPGLRTFGHQLMRSAAPALPLHYHKDAFEVVLVTEGDVSFWINGVEARGMVQEVHLVQPNTPHSTNNKPLTNGEIYWLQLETDVPDTLYLTRRSWETIEQRLCEAGNTVLRLESAWQQQLVVDAFKLASSRYFDERYRIARDTLIRPDFYLPEFDLYIEYWGMDTPEYNANHQKKLWLYQRAGKKLVSLSFRDLPSLEDVLSLKLSRYIRL